MQVKFKNVLFDLDGTLVDSAGDILACLNKAFASATGEAGFRAEERLIGYPVREIAARTLAGASAERIEAVNSEFRRRYDGSSYPATRLFPGVRAALIGLEAMGCALFIVTNKPSKPALAILRKLNIAVFTEVVCPEAAGGAGAGKAVLIAGLLEKRGLARAETLYVGDSEGDVEAARQNGLAAAAALYGYGDKGKILALSPEYLLGDISSLTEVVLDCPALTVCP